jgi:hypothetical protein
MASAGTALLPFLNAAHSWLQRHDRYADGILVEPPIGKMAKVAANGGSAKQGAKQANNLALMPENDLAAALQQTELQLLLGGQIRTLRPVAGTSLPDTVQLYTQYADLLLVSIEDYRNLVIGYSLQSRIQSPVLVMGPGHQKPSRVVLPADVGLLKHILPLKKYLWDECETIVLATEQANADEKMLMAYIQGHCKRPGYMFLDPEWDKQLLGILQPGTLLVSYLRHPDPTAQHLHDFALQHFADMNLTLALA